MILQLAVVSYAAVLLRTPRADLARSAGRLSACPAVWPQPQHLVCTAGKPVAFSRTIAITAPAELRAAAERALARDPQAHVRGEQVQHLVIEVASTELAGPETDESYGLNVGAPNTTLRARTAVGALRGLETLAQLAAGPRTWSSARVRDAPRFRHRGALLDTSRHFLSVATLKSFLDAMAMTKLNVLHWHLTDAQGYSLGDAVSKKYNLDRGALFSGATYSEADLAAVVAHAKGLGIRVIPELDGPAHVQSWARSPNLTEDVIPCGYDSVFEPVGDKHIPHVLDELVGKLATIFPDERIHFGADEVNAKAFACMRNSTRVRTWVREEMGHRAEKDLVGIQDLRDAVASYVGMVAAIGHKHGKKPIFWEEAFTDYGRDGDPPVQLLHAGDAMVQVWHGTARDSMPDHVRDVVAAGLGAIKSSDWYLNWGTDTDWQYNYRIDPERGVAHRQRALLWGGEAALWGENISEANLFSRAFPRLSAVAERLWSPGSVVNLAAAAPRLQALQCQMAARGYNVTHLQGGGCSVVGGGAAVLLLKRGSTEV